MATLLETIQEFCSRTGIRRPASVSGSSDVQILQIMGLANEICELLSDEYIWNELVREATFTSVAGEDQGEVTTHATNGFLAVVGNTLYDRTQKVPLYGPMNAQMWQQNKAFIPAGPLYRYRIRGGNLLFSPAADAGHTIAFEYYSKNIIYNTTDDEYKSAFTKDGDTFLLDAKLLLLGLRWKWKNEKGLPYAEEYEHFQRACRNGAARDATKPTIYMDGDPDYFVGPNILIQPGSWDL